MMIVTGEPQRFQLEDLETVVSLYLFQACFCLINLRRTLTAITVYPCACTSFSFSFRLWAWLSRSFYCSSPWLHAAEHSAGRVHTLRTVNRAAHARQLIVTVPYVNIQTLQTDHPIKTQNYRFSVTK